MKPKFSVYRVGRSQDGVALIVALMFMVVLTIVGIAIVNSTSSDEKMARNFRDSDVAFAAAEAALRDAELHISGAWRVPYAPVDLASFNSTCDGGLCDATPASAQSFQPVDRLDFYGSSGAGSNSLALGAVTGTGSVAIQDVAAQPRYMVEVVCTALGSQVGATCNKAFRITAQAQGRSSNTRVTLQEIYLPADFVN